MQISELIDAAKMRGGFKSDAALSRALGLTDTVVVQMRRGTHRPSPTIMARLAEYAGIDARLAVLELLEEREDNPKTKAIFAEIRRFFIQATAAVLLLTAQSSVVKHSTNVSTLSFGTLYIIANNRMIRASSR